MNHMGTVTLETERLILRRFMIDDADAMFLNWASDDLVTKYLTWPTHSDVSVSRSVISSWLKLYQKPEHYSWAIVLKEIGEPIGSIAAVEQRDDTKMVHIGYCIGRKWWHKGYTSEALKELIRFFFEEVGVNRIESRRDPRNPNSGKVMLKCGLRYEGVMLQSDINNQGLCDTVRYALLAEDYFNKLEMKDCFNNFAIEEVNEEKEKSKICNDILRALPSWFGVETSIVDYVEQVKQMPFYAAFEHGVPIGFVAIKIHNAYTAEVCVMGVLKEYHRQGIGKKLLKYVDDYCRNNKMSFLTVKTLDESRESKSYEKTRLFYQSVGFKPLEVFPLLWDKDNPCLFMAKNISERT